MELLPGLHKQTASRRVKWGHSAGDRNFPSRMCQHVDSWRGGQNEGDSISLPKSFTPSHSPVAESKTPLLLLTCAFAVTYEKALPMPQAKISFTAFWWCSISSACILGFYSLRFKCCVWHDLWLHLSPVCSCPAPLLKRYFFAYWMIMVPLSKINKP